MSTRYPVVSTRLSSEALAVVRRTAAARRETLSVHVRAALTALSNGDAEAGTMVFAQLLKLLGLPDNASASQVREAVQAALDEALGPETADPLAAAPEPPVALTTLSRLSTSDRASLAKRGIATEAQFQAAKAAMPRSPSKTTKAKAK